jgi:hypothetical protein
MQPHLTHLFFQIKQLNENTMAHILKIEDLDDFEIESVIAKHIDAGKTKALIIRSKTTHQYGFAQSEFVVKVNDEDNTITQYLHTAIEEYNKH